MRRQSASDQLKQINALFSNNTRRESEIQVIDTQRDLKCDVHNRGRRRSSIDSNHADGCPLRKDPFAALPEVIRRASIASSTTSKDDQLRRRQSFTEGYGYSNADRNRKRNSTTSTTFNKNIEHPSAFPSLLRASTPSPGSGKTNGDASHSDSRKNSLTRRSSNNSLNNYGYSVTVKAKPSTATLNKNKSFGGSNLYLRRDSSGQTNLVRRDSYGSTNLSSILTGSNGGGTNYRKGSVPRDYVSQPFAQKTAVNITTNGKASILRKNSSESAHNDRNKLTRENLSRHVTILESGNRFRNTDSSEDDDVIRMNNNNNINNGINHNGKSNGTNGNHHHHHHHVVDGRPRKYSNGSIEDYLKSRRISVDSLDLRRSSIESPERDFSHLHLGTRRKSDTPPANFIAVTTLDDTHAVRCAEFHPSGEVYALGSNSKTFRICEYPSNLDQRDEPTTTKIIYESPKYHKGSIYCIGWSPDGELVATGSNDKTIKITRYDEIQQKLRGPETELTMHDGTIRDLCFLEDSSNKASLLISGGAGDCKIYVTDCATGIPFQALSGHSGVVSSLYSWGGALFVSGSKDKTIRFWDLRTYGCVNTVTPPTTMHKLGSSVSSVCVDPSGRLLVSGHEDSSCVLYDIRGDRPIQSYKPHSADIRSARFSPSAYYLLTAGSDSKLVLSDLQGDLTLPLPNVLAAFHGDKVTSGRWHPRDFSFVSTSADRTATLWTMPQP